MSKDKKGRTIKRYSESFKQGVIRQIEQEGLSIGEACRRYGIGGSSTIQSWSERYGRQSLRNTKIVVMKADEQSELKAAQARVKELEQALVQLQLEKLAGESYLEIACERLGQEVEEFKKKHQPKR